MSKTTRIGVLMVCMGNICRSPTAEGVFRQRLREAGLEDAVRLDSAGTHSYHIGKSPDSRASQVAARRGYDLSDLVGRQVSPTDFDEFDLILAMDHDNLANLKSICPRGQEHKLRLFLSFSSRYTGQEVPDPYYGGAQGFDHVLDMVEDAAEGLLDEIRRRQA
ncbi:MAG: low molecular weight phosphotyrosine protein phosphatase [Gallionellaceae bacterium]|nr:low molecular weight phosphotyrosine protein phosphatase [Gallionellaceae bacterium]